MEIGVGEKWRERSKDFSENSTLMITIRVSDQYYGYGIVYSLIKHKINIIDHHAKFTHLCSQKIANKFKQFTEMICVIEQQNYYIA